MKNNIYTILARDSITYFLKHQKIMNLPPNLPKSLLNTKAGIFVSLHNKSDGELRGCIGTFLPTKSSVAKEIIYNAVAAATEDPRFPPVTSNELSNIEISVDVLSEPKPISDIKTLNPKNHGLIVCTADGKRGLLLPDIEGVNTVEEQERICRLKAGISPNELVSYQVFTVTRHHKL